MADRYPCFAELMRHHAEGIDYEVDVRSIDSYVAVIAPHGGTIEPMTAEIAAQVAEADYCYYAFRARMHGAFETLHITSSRFDERRCLDLIGNCGRVVAIHGLAGGDETLVGGLDAELRELLTQELNDAGIASRSVSTGRYAATSPTNVCNRGRSGMGVQVEFPRQVRDQLRSSPVNLSSCVAAMKAAIGKTR